MRLSHLVGVIAIASAVHFAHAEPPPSGTKPSSGTAPVFTGEGDYPNGALHQGKRLPPGTYYPPNRYYNCLSFTEEAGNPVVTSKCSEHLSLWCYKGSSEQLCGSLNGTSDKAYLWDIDRTLVFPCLTKYRTSPLADGTPQTWVVGGSFQFSVRQCWDPIIGPDGEVLQ